MPNGTTIVALKRQYPLPDQVNFIDMISCLRLANSYDKGNRSRLELTLFHLKFWLLTYYYSGFQAFYDAAGLYGDFLMRRNPRLIRWLQNSDQDCFEDLVDNNRWILRLLKLTYCSVTHSNIELAGEVCHLHDEAYLRAETSTFVEFIEFQIRCRLAGQSIGTERTIRGIHNEVTSAYARSRTLEIVKNRDRGAILYAANLCWEDILCFGKDWSETKKLIRAQAKQTEKMILMFRTASSVFCTLGDPHKSDIINTCTGLSPLPLPPLRPVSPAELNKLKDPSKGRALETSRGNRQVRRDVKS